MACTSESPRDYSSWSAPQVDGTSIPLPSNYDRAKVFVDAGVSNDARAVACAVLALCDVAEKLIFLLGPRAFVRPDQEDSGG